MRTGGYMWAALAIAVGIGLFMVKYKVQALEDELINQREQIVRDRSAIRVLEAEWTYLNDPERLRRLSAQHLGFGAAVPQNMVDISGLPYRVPSNSVGAVAAPDMPTRSVPAANPPGPQAELPGLHADAVPLSPASFQRPGGLPVILARLQRMLLPEAVGATTREDQR